MAAELVIRGIIIGLLASIPLGPIGVLCIQRTINKGKLSGFISGMGASVADTIFAAIAGFGLSYITNFIQEQQNIIEFAGGMLIMILGVKIFFSNPITQIKRNRKKKNNLYEDFFSVLILTLSNLLAAIFLFGALFAAIGGTKATSSPMATIYTVIGVFAGSTFWWYTLSSFVNIFRRKFRLRQLFWMNRLTGVVIIIFGIAALFKVLIIH